MVGGNRTKGVSFTCIGTGAPLLRISWFVDGKNVTDLEHVGGRSSRYTTNETREGETRVFSKLTIDNPTYEDNGQYVCVATILDDTSGDEEYRTEKKASLTVLGEF